MGLAGSARVSKEHATKQVRMCLKLLGRKHLYTKALVHDVLVSVYVLGRVHVAS